MSSPYDNLLPAVQKMVSECVVAGEMSRRLGIGPGAVRRLLTKAGVPKFYRPTACEKNREKVMQMVQDGRSLSEIGRTVGTNDQRVRQFLEANGIRKKWTYANKGSKNGAWMGGRNTTKDGYIQIHAPDHPNCNSGGYVLEHRLVMENMIGRFLNRQEVVHHRNGKKADNKPGNLQLFSENGLHLAHDLKGKCPNWTSEGKARLLEVCRQNGLKTRGRNRGKKAPDDLQCM